MNRILIKALWLIIFSISALMAVEIVPVIDKKIYREGYASITLRLDDRNISRVMIVTDKNEGYPVILSKECDNVCSRTIKLHPGENTIRIKGYKGERLVYEEKNTIFFVSPSHKGAKTPPNHFKEKFFHTEENEKMCSECHDMSINEEKGVAFVNAEESNCYGCHKHIIDEKYGHAPALNWLCTGCHTVNATRLAWESKFRTAKPIASICFTCHDKSKQIWDTKKYRHLPVDSGHCTRCHNPHAAPNAMFNHESALTLCLGCHGDKKFSSAMRGDSKCPGEERGSCVGCHNPHASDTKFFLDDPHGRGVGKAVQQ